MFKRLLGVSGCFPGSLFSLLLGLGLVLNGVAQTAQAGVSFISIGTGGSTGVYFPVGGTIAKILNDRKDTYNIKATAEATGASVHNIRAVLAGDLDFGFAQADCQYQAVNGVLEWAGHRQENLRSVFALSSEMVTFVVADNSGIQSIADVKGKSLNIGNMGSGNRQNSIDVLRAAGFDYETDLKTLSIKAADAPRLVQDGRLDGFFYTVGHPNRNILEATSGARKVRIVPIPDLMTLAENYPYYTIAEVNMAFYPDAANASAGMVPTVAMSSTLVTAARVRDEVVYNLTKAVFENLDELKASHPALRMLTPGDMLKGLSAPLHPGAEKYYKEIGLLK